MTTLNVSVSEDTLERIPGRAFTFLSAVSNVPAIREAGRGAERRAAAVARGGRHAPCGVARKSLRRVVGPWFRGHMTMLDAMRTYFDGEKLGGALIAAVGLASIAWAGWTRMAATDLRGMFWPMLLLGLLQVGIGVGLHARTGPQVTVLERQLAAAPTDFYAAETPRMDRVQRNFGVIEVVEVVLLVVGIALGLAMKGRLTPWGVGLALVLHAAFLFAFDLTAERRGKLYLDALQQNAAQRDGGAPPGPR